MDITSLIEFWEMLNHSPSEILEKYPLFLLGLWIIVALLVAFLITKQRIPGSRYIAVIGIVIMVIGIMSPKKVVK